MVRRVLPGWVAGYRREWLRPDVIAGLVVGTVVVPQCVAYAQIAGLPPQAGLMAAPGALIGYALLGSSRSLVVSATTATSAISAAAVGPLGGGDPARFAALSAALAIVAGLVLVAGGVLRLGVISEFVSKPVITGFMFGLALTIIVDQAPKLLGEPEGSGGFFARVGDLVGRLGSAHVATVAVGAASVAGLVLLPRLVRRLPATLLVLAGAIAVSALLDLRHHGVAVVGHLPQALPDAAWPDVSAHDLAELVPAGFGVLLLATEAVGVARAMAITHHYSIDANRELSAIGVGNVLAGLSSGFVQSGGASQTAAADRAGGRSQLATLVAAALILLTGAFLSPLFTTLPEATLAAIVIVAVAGFLRVDELRRFARIRLSAIVLSSLCLAGVLTLGVLRGLIVTAALSLVVVIQRLSRPQVTGSPRDDGAVTVRVEGPLYYANANAVRERTLALAQGRPVVLDLSMSAELDVESLDMLDTLARSVELRLTGVQPRARALLRRAGLSGLMSGAPAAPGSPGADEARPPRPV